jgi:hypothetical protein
MHAALESREARGDSAAFVTRSRVVKARSLVAARADASRAPDASETGARGRARRGAGRPARSVGLAGRDTGLGVARAGGGAFERAPHARVVVVSLRAAESRRGVVALLALVSVGPAPAGHLRTRAGWGEARRVASRGGSVAGGVRTRAARGNARAAKGGAVARARRPDGKDGGEPHLLVASASPALAAAPGAAEVHGLVPAPALRVLLHPLRGARGLVGRTRARRGRD